MAGIKVVRDESPRARLANEAAANYRRCRERARSLLKQTSVTGFDSFQVSHDAEILMVELKRHVPHDRRYRELMREVSVVRHRLRGLPADTRVSDRRNHKYEQFATRVGSAERRLLASFRGPTDRQAAAALRSDLGSLLSDLDRAVGEDNRLRAMRDQVRLMLFEPATFNATTARALRRRDIGIVGQVVPQGMVSSGQLIAGNHTVRGGLPGSGKRS